MMLIQIEGHLGADPETRFTPSGQKVTALRVAVNLRKGDKERTVWWRVTIWGDRFDKRLAYMKKGSSIFALGEMHAPEMYTDKTGVQQVAMEMTAEYLTFSQSSARQKSQDGSSGDGEAANGFSGPATTAGAGQANIVDDDIPF